MKRLSGGKTVEVSVRMPEALVEKLRVAAGERTFSEYVRDVLEAHVAGLPAPVAAVPAEPEAEVLAGSVEEPVAERTLVSDEELFPRDEF